MSDAKGRGTGNVAKVPNWFVEPGAVLQLLFPQLVSLITVVLQTPDGWTLGWCVQEEEEVISVIHPTEVTPVFVAGQCSLKLCNIFQLFGTYFNPSQLGRLVGHLEYAEKIHCIQLVLQVGQEILRSLRLES